MEHFHNPCELPWVVIELLQDGVLDGLRVLLDILGLLLIVEGLENVAELLLERVVALATLRLLLLIGSL